MKEYTKHLLFMYKMSSTMDIAELSVEVVPVFWYTLQLPFMVR
jgi:hypothetical protein